MASMQKRNVNGNFYWYIVESKRINGKPTPVVIQYLGSIENILMHFKDDKATEAEYQSFEHGAVYGLIQIAKKVGLLEILGKHFKSQTRDGLKREESLLLAAIHRVIQPRSKRAFSKWVETTTLPALMNFKPEQLTSQHFWDQMEGITEEELIACEDAITKRVFEMYDFNVEKLILDYTNYFSYIATVNEQNTLAQRGHNKQKRYDLRQYSLAVTTTKDVLFPLCSHIYEGNVPDQTEFPIYIDMLKRRIPEFDPDKITLVYDGGSNNKKNLALIKNMHLHYLCAFSLSVCKKLYDIPLAQYKSVRIEENEILYFRIRQEIWDEERDAVLTFSRDLFTGQLREMDHNIEKTITELLEISNKLENIKSKIDRSRESIEQKIKKILNKNYMNDVFEVKIIGDSTAESISWNIDSQRKSEIVNRIFGKKLLITDRSDWSIQEILKTYSDQYIVEKLFRDTKNPHHFSIRPQYHWTDAKIRVNIFCCLLGLVMTSLLRKEMASHQIAIENSPLIDELSKIRECWIFSKTKKNKSGYKIEKKIERLNDEQEALWRVIKSI